jgi:hypothetical protein
MNRGMLVGGAVVMLAAGFALGAETKKSLVDTYNSIADSILAANKSEHNVVVVILENHHHAAMAAFKAGKFDDCAAEMALFASEGDNAVGGIRKRLVEGGHHHNAEGEEKGLFDTGFVVVTKAAKKAILASVAAMQGAKDEAGHKAAWDAFEAAAGPLVTAK